MRRRKSKLKHIISNIWKDKKSTIAGAIGAALLMIGQLLLGGEMINWKIVIGAAITFLAGAITNTKTEKENGEENKEDGAVSGPHVYDPNDDLDFLQSEDSRYYKDHYR